MVLKFQSHVWFKHDYFLMVWGVTPVKTFADSWGIPLLQKWLPSHGFKAVTTFKTEFLIVWRCYPSKNDYGPIVLGEWPLSKREVLIVWIWFFQKSILSHGFMGLRPLLMEIVTINPCATISTVACEVCLLSNLLLLDHRSSPKNHQTLDDCRFKWSQKWRWLTFSCMIVLNLALHIRVNVLYGPHVGLEFLIYVNGQLELMTG